MKRRDFLRGSAAAALAGTSALPLTRGALAADKPEQIVVMTWGGLWGDSIKAGVDAAFEKATGIKVLQDRSGSPADRITKLRVDLNDQKYDVVQIHDGLVPLAVKEGVFEKIDRSSPRLANLKDVYPRFVQDYWIAQIFSPLGVVYNTKQVKTPPTGFADLWRPEFKGRIVLPDISHSIGPYIIPIGALAQGKDPKDTNSGYEMLKKMADLQPIWAKDTDSIMNALRDEEAVIGILYKSQTYTVQGWGTPVQWVYPKEGALLYSSGTAVAKNTKNKIWAETYLNLTLDPKVQTIYTEKFNYPGTNRKMVDLLPANLQERVKMSDDEFKKLVDLDQAFMADHRAEMTDRWNRIVAGG